MKHTRACHFPAVAAALAFLMSSVRGQNPVISEFMADNVSELADADGQFTDWIEIENPGTSAVNLEQWSLTDSAAQPTKWRFPAVTLPAGGRLVVFASGKNRVDPGQQLHTNFALNAGGGYLALVRPDGTTRASEFNPYPPQTEDVSYGTAQQRVVQPLINGAAGRVLVPAGATPPAAGWNTAGFTPDASWTLTSVPPGIGYDTGSVAPPAVNIAASGTATQSTTLTPYGANLGNDGIATNFTHTAAGDAAPFWNLDFGSAASIQSITILNRGDGCCGSRLRDITVQILDDTQTPVFTSVLLNPENQGFTYPAGPASLTVNLLTAAGGPVSGRHVRISRTADPDLSGSGGQGDVNEGIVLSMGEVQVVGTLPGAVVNLARTGSPAPVATQTSTLGSFTAALAINGSNADFSHTLSSDTAPAWTLNLNRRAVIQSVAVRNRESCCQERLRNITIEILDSNGTTVLHASALLNPNNAMGSPADLIHDVAAANGGNPVLGQFVRIRRTTDAAATDDARVLSLGEVQVRGTELNGYRSFLRTNLESSMLGTASTAYWRLPFTLGVPPASVRSLTLRVRYDDGFRAWLNGVEAGSRNAPADAGPTATATAQRSLAEGFAAETMDLGALIPQLAEGENVLAFHGLNFAAADSDFLLQPELSATLVSERPNVYLSNATPGTTNDSPWYVDEVADTQFSHRRGFYEAPFALTITSATPGAQIYYTTDNSEPTPTNGTLYTGPITVSSTAGTSTAGARVIRARAFRTDWKPTNIDTHTYIFPPDITSVPRVSMSTAGAITAGTAANIPPLWPVNAATNGGQAFIWGFDAGVRALYNADQIREALRQIPVISLVTQQNNLTDPVTGIYVNGIQRGQAWERPASIEMLDYAKPGATPEAGHGEFGTFCGIRIRGGASRNDSSTKHSFRVFFRDAYGDGKLNYRLYGADGAAEFDTFDLRGSQNYSWSQNASDVNETMVRDPFCRMTLAAMGQPSTRTRYCHLFLNGLYWGIYDIHERAENSFGETYLGGNKDNFDVIKCGDRYTLDFKTEATDGYLTTNPDGTKAAWRDLWDRSIAHRTAPTNENYFRMLGRNPDGTRNPAYPVLVDVDNLIDYMMVIFYTGDGDAVLSSFLGNNKPNNWHSMRDRTDDRGFNFFLQDGEHTLLAPSWGADRTGPFLNMSNSTLPDWSNPQWIHDSLALNPEYRLRFADRVRKHFFNGGAMTAAVARQRWLDKAATINRAIRLYAARYSNTSTGENAWNTRINFVRDNFFASRPATVLAQFAADGLWPNVTAPDFSQHGGSVPGGYALNMTVPPGGQVYYTIDGSDPRTVGNERPLPFTFSARDATARWRASLTADDGHTVTPPPALPTTGLVGRWRLDGSAADSAGSTTGTLVGSPTWSAGLNGQAITLNGTTQYVALGNPTALQLTGQITMAAWIRPTATDGLRNIVARGYNTTPSGEVMMRISAGNLEAGTWNGSNFVASATGVVQLNEWQHVCGLFDGAAWRLYRNGVEIASFATTQGAANVAGSATANNAWAIGSRGGTAERLFAGQIDEVTIYNRGLTPAEVSALHLGTQPSLTVAEWKEPAWTVPATWGTAAGGFGFDGDPTVSFTPHITTNVQTAMQGVTPSLLTRRTFTLTPQQRAAAVVLQLNVRYDDGFVAWLNGTRIASRNAPAVTNGLSAATAVRPDADAVVSERIDVTAYLSSLRDGENVLAIQGLNTTAADGDFLLDAELMAGDGSPALTPGAQLYGGPVTLQQPVTVKARTLLNGVWSPLTEAFFSVATVPASASNLVISEMHYHPLDPVLPGELLVSPDQDEFEFLEIMNILSGVAVDLTDVRFTGGITTTPLVAAVLQPGERAVFVKNPAAFAARYGASWPNVRILGTWSGSLSNQGERVILNGVGGSVIRDFVYDDNAPWPTAADGTGRSLVLAAPLTNPDHALPGSWRAGSVGGTPGLSAWQRWAQERAVTNPEDDSDRDGRTAFMEYVLGSSPGTADAAEPISAVSGPDGHLRISLIHADAEDVALEPLVSPDLAVWGGGMVLESSGPNGDGRTITVWRSAAPMAASSRQFVKLRAELR